MARIVLGAEPAIHLPKIRHTDIDDFALHVAIRHGAVQANGGSASPQPLEGRGQRLDADPRPAQMTFEKQAVREGHAVVGPDIHEIALAILALEKCLVDEGVLTMLRERLHRCTRFRLRYRAPVYSLDTLPQERWARSSCIGNPGQRRKRSDFHRLFLQWCGREDSNLHGLPR